jgi:hypothetical protein
MYFPPFIPGKTRSRIITPTKLSSGRCFSSDVPRTHSIFFFSFEWNRSLSMSPILHTMFRSAVGVFPTTPEIGATETDKIIGKVHFASAAAFFVTLAMMSILLFTKTHPEDTKRRRGFARLSQLLVTSTLPGRSLSRRKKARNLIYRICGYTIAASIVAMLVGATLPGSASLEQLHPTFWLESLAVVAFGVSWLVKGETLLRDRKSRVATAVAVGSGGPKQPKGAVPRPTGSGRGPTIQT